MKKCNSQLPCISSVGIYGVSWWSNFPSSTVCFFTLLPCAKYQSTANCYAQQGYKTGLGFCPQIEGCVWQYLWQEGGFVCADLTCLQLSVFARPGLARACLCVPVRDSHPSLQTQENQMPCCQFPLSCNLASLSEWSGIYFFFLPLLCTTDLSASAAARWCWTEVRTGSVVLHPVACGTTWCFHRLQVVPCILSHTAPFSASLQPRPARTHAWEPLVSWDLKPLAHVITQIRVCWQPQPLPASLSGALGHDLLVLWLGYE